ncbi:hypothetical protein [Nonomuraea bangladeshensis]|uniref:hypothetical protein n=1 Tax=Nonomuraea bangladeshensis TaxID=404385 RepID=UPI003C2F9C99
MRTVYVVTTKPGSRTRTARLFLALLAARMVYLTAWLGHAVVQLAGGLDAILTAWLGIPRFAVLARRVRAALRETWEA